MDQCFCWTSFRVKRSRNKKRRRNRNSKVSRYFNNTKKFELFDIMHNAGRNEIERITHINKYMKVYTTSFMSEPLVFLNRRKSPELVLTNIFRYTQKFEKVSTASSLSVASSMPSLAAHIYQRKRIGFFSKKLAIHVSEFPCLRDEGDGTSLYVVLPATLVSDTWTIKQNITKDDIFNLVLRLLEPNGVVVLQELLHGVKALEGDDTGIETWPTFKVETNVEIPNLLEFLDKEESFVPGAIDLWKDRTRNAKNEHKLNLVHRVRVDITGNHTNLCAINSICTEEGIEQKPNIFEVNNDYPFVWFIYDKEFREIFFIGVFQNPKKSDPEMFEKIV
ncbi:uncharacterized protein LOC114930264 [Nylanderia fulva]|uniref:uncharacterized protein LOC114930264 n=1 Tax=Nylanderia fulva TaxID=613905 RepID=UPI0010FB60F9|nr:uncharacterized protein LOC114930264 [Nylanderia fulva]XP_029157840.1 uncharacterized protein LOC114930264 [Nylanderia fulva]